MALSMHVGARVPAVHGAQLSAPFLSCTALAKDERRKRWTLRSGCKPTVAQAASTTDVQKTPEIHTSSSAMPPFHLAFPVSDLKQTKSFYGSLLGCPEGRSAAGWVDYNLFGHQIVCHQVKGYNANASANAVDGDPVPVPHFGLALSVQQFHDLAERVKQADVQFVIQPHLRFKGQPGEQWTMFFKDPSGNALEFKAMTTPENLFAKYYVS
ncbi:TPA: hypothetical protein ACH3X1_006868 [Trebouxia sp. C0004]